MSNDLIIITGSRGVGKTSLAATYLPPGQEQAVYFHDAEDSANTIVSDLADLGTSFGRYVKLTERFTDLPTDDDLLHRINAAKLPWVDRKGKASLIDYYEYVIDDLDKNLTPGKYRVYVHDTLEKLESGMVAWVDANKKIAGTEDSPTRTRGGQFWWGALYPLYEQIFSALYARGIETIILTSHVKGFWSAGKPVPGKVDAGGKPMLFKRSILFLWLVNEYSNPDGAPAALVLKERLGKLSIVDGRWKMAKRLPRRVPHCTWDDIWRYRDVGADLEHPAPGETMSAAEEEMISGFLTDPQMRLMVLEAEKELAEVSKPVIPVVPSGTFSIAQEPANDRILELAGSGMSIDDIAREIGMPKPVVKRLLGNDKEE